MTAEPDPSADASPLRRIFLGALNLGSPAERDAFLDVQCSQDTALRAQVEALLRSHRSDGFLEAPAAGLADTRSVEAGEGSQPHSELDVESRIGPYKLLQKIGEGGMGAVYMAEQTAPMVRRVALKVIKLGMDTKQVIARFEAERQALSLMDHPNIAKVLDAGATATGRPYFVMELVRGVRITDYCDDHRLSPRARLDLFIPVCHAIQHAHQKGIIHRDIKPSNILVTLYDGVPVPKVIDFGVAKATEGRLTDKTLFTAFEQFIGTPAYMSPEQVELSGLDIDTRSDIYSLGVLLYELLTGTTPFDARELLALGFETMRRTLREQEPVRPSTRLRTMLEGRLSTTAKSRSSEAPSLIHLLSGDLDWIVMKCLEKDRTRRYESAGGLASEIQRHLHHEPISARPPTTGYRLGRWIRRNQLVFGSAVAVTAALVLGAGISIVQAVRARRAEAVALQLQGVAQDEARRAQTEKARAEQLATESKNRLLRFTVGNGIQLLNQSNHVHSLLWFAKGVALSEGDPEQEGINRLRFASTLRQCPRLLQVGVHTHWVYVSVFSPDGTKLLSCSNDGTGRVWDTTTGEPLSPPLRDPSPMVVAGSFSPDGRRVILSHGTAFKGTNCARIWDVTSGREMTPALPHEGLVIAVAYSPDGRRVLTASYDHTGRVWDATTGAPVTPPLRHELGLNRGSFSPDGRLVLTSSYDQTARLWDAATGDPVSAPLAHHQTVATAEFSRDGARIVTGSFDGEIRLWDARTGQAIGEPLRYPGAVQFASFSPDGRSILAAGDANSARIWDTESRALHPVVLPYYSARAFWYHYPTFSADGTRVVTRDSRTSSAIWDPRRGRQLGPSMPHNEGLMDMRWNSDGTRLATASGEGLTRIWDVSGASSTPPAVHVPRYVNRVPRSSDGRRMVLLLPGNQAQVFDLATREPVAPPLSHASNVVYAAFSRHGHTVFTSGDDWNARLWNADTGVPLSPPIPNNKSVGVAAFSPDDSRVAFASRLGTVKVVDARTGAPLSPVNGIELPGLVQHLAFSRDGRWLVTASDLSARIWDVATGEPVTPFLRHLAPVLWASISPDSRLIATGGADGTARVWDVATGDPVVAPFWHEHAVLRVAFARDSRRLLTQCSDGAWWWDLPTESRPTEELTLIGESLSGHRIDASGALIPLRPEAIDAAWRKLRDRHPGQAIVPPYRGPREFAATTDELRELEPDADILETPGIPLTAPNPGNARPVDLSKAYNASLDEDWISGTDPNTRSAVPRGIQEMGGTKFEIRGVVQLNSANLDHSGIRKYPDAIRGISVGRRARYLHFLHSGGGGIHLADFVIRYRNGRTWQIPIHGAEDGLSLGFRDESYHDVARAVVAWTGRSGPDGLRIYNSTWENPFPDEEIESLDVVSVMEWVTMTLFAITTE